MGKLVEWLSGMNLREIGEGKEAFLNLGWKTRKLTVNLGRPVAGWEIGHSWTQWNFDPNREKFSRKFSVLLGRDFLVCS